MRLQAALQSEQIGRPRLTIFLSSEVPQIAERVRKLLGELEDFLQLRFGETRAADADLLHGHVARK
jgi:hypothetical protein